MKEHLLCAVDEYFIGFALDKSEVFYYNIFFLYVKLYCSDGVL